ncbi:MAG TPA: outer membrane protein transport protein [Acidobacteriota bacterium]|nr:outer membrane protein transport protein [Acidobacteriota bacterium]
MHRYRVTILLVAILSTLAAATAWPQGFGLYEQSPCAMGRGGAGVAAPCPDASSVFFNPAGLSFTTTQVGLGGAVVGPRGHFTDSATSQISTLNDHWYPVPNVYFSTPLAKRFAFGIGVFAPYGLTTDWPVTSEGRYLGYKSLVQAVYLQPTLALKFSDKFSVGAGVDVTYLNVQLRQRVDLATQLLPALPGVPPGTTFQALGVKLGTDFADLDLKGHVWHPGYHLGILIKPSEHFSIGARYLSGQEVDLNDGTIETTQISVPYSLPFAIPGVPAGTPLDVLLKPQFAPGQPLGNQKASTRLPLPAQFVVGTALQIVPKVKLLLDYQFTRWSMFDQLPVNGQFLKSVVIESYRDTHGARLGTEIALSDKSVLRAGTDLHTAAAPDQTVTPNLPEGWRQEYAVGFGRQLWERLRFDFAYMRLVQPDRAGRTTNAGKAAPTAADNNGTYRFGANLLGASLSLKF